MNVIDIVLGQGTTSFRVGETIPVSLKCNCAIADPGELSIDLAVSRNGVSGWTRVWNYGPILGGCNRALGGGIVTLTAEDGIAPIVFNETGMWYVAVMDCALHPFCGPDYAPDWTMARKAIYIMSPPQPGYGGLKVSTEPSGATVKVDGYSWGTTPVAERDVIAGAHTVNVTLQGYKPVTETVTVTEASTTTWHRRLTAAPIEEQILTFLTENWTWIALGTGVMVVAAVVVGSNRRKQQMMMYQGGWQ